MAQKYKTVINVGNVLNLIDIKTSQQPTEELSESVQMTIKDWQKDRPLSKLSDAASKQDSSVVIFRNNDDSKSKMSEEDRKDLKVGIKVFIHNDRADYLEECLENVYQTLGIDLVENVILSYYPVTSNNISNSENGDDTSKCDQLIGLKKLWSVVEKYAKSGRILQVGVADLDEKCFYKLHEMSDVKPSIIQINMTSCCVVPPELQAFCKDNDIQLLTHSDPKEIITKDTLSRIINSKVDVLRWCARYQVHIKCRGVLTLKGYMLSADFQN